MERPEHSNDMEAMREMIQKEIQSIASLEERVAFKELMEEVFLSLYETSRQMYDQLEQRVAEEVIVDWNRYQIKTGIVEKEYFDVSHRLMFAMDKGDLEEDHYDVKEIQQALTESGSFPLMKIMLCCDYLEIQKMWQNPPVFPGTIETELTDTEWEIEVQLQKNDEYLKRIEFLYQLFVKNGIPWQTVNAPYLHKMADVVITKLPEGILWNDKIRQVTIQFGNYSRYIVKQIIPVWNMERLALSSIGFPAPCEDHMNFEHSISLSAYDPENACLVEDDREIRSVRQDGDKLRIISETGEAKKWSIYMLHSSEESRIDRYTYPVMSNGRMKSFADSYQKKWNQSIRTRTEIAHFLKGFGLEDYVCYQDCRIAEDFPGPKETYPVNYFIADEIRERAAQSKLILYFKPGQKETWLQRDIVSFLVSEVQRIYPEYDCGGVLL